MKILLKGGTVISGDSCLKADVLMAEGQIEEISENLNCKEAEVVDVSGKLLFPGFIDAHTHFNLEVAGTVTADDFVTGTKAAISGGTTMIIDFATQYKGETLQQALLSWHKKADGKASCDYGFHMSIADWNEQVKDEIAIMMREGVTSFKMYTIYEAMQIKDKELYQVLKQLKAVGGIAGVHCENSGLIEALQEEKRADKEARTSVMSHPLTRPVEAEAEAIDRVLRIAKVVDIPIIIVHLSSKEGYQVIQAARERGQQIVVETCPQYLLLDDSCYEKEWLESAKYVISPPLRKKEDRECLWKAVEEGNIQTLATDHCSFTTMQKKLGMEDFSKIPGGMALVEQRGLLLYEFGVKSGRITMPQMCRLLSENAAKIYGLYPKKGVIQKGSDADIVVIDPSKEQIITAEKQKASVDYAIFEGTKIHAEIDSVYLRGELTVKKDKLIQAFNGRFVKRKARCKG